MPAARAGVNPGTAVPSCARRRWGVAVDTLLTRHFRELSAAGRARLRARWQFCHVMTWSRA